MRDTDGTTRFLPLLFSLTWLTVAAGCGAPLPEEYGVYLRKGGEYEAIPDEDRELSSLESPPSPEILIHSKVVTSGREPRDLIQLVGRAYVRAGYESPRNPLTLARIARMDEVRLDQVPLSMRPVSGRPEMIEAEVEHDLPPGSYALVVGDRSFAFEVLGDGSRPDIDAEDHAPCLDRNGERYDPCDAVEDSAAEWASVLDSSLATGHFTAETFSRMKALAAVSPDLRGKEESARKELLAAVNDAVREERWRAAIRLASGTLGVWSDEAQFQSLLSEANSKQRELMRVSQTPSNEVDTFQDLFYRRNWQATPSGVTITDVGLRYYGWTGRFERGYHQIWFGDFRPHARINVSCAAGRSPYSVNIFKRDQTGVARWEVSFQDRGECDRFVDALVATFGAWRNRFAHIPPGFGPEGGLSIKRIGRNPGSRYHESP